MISKKLEGIVVSAVDYKESSKILNIYTRELGIIGVIARGSKRIKSSLSGVSNRLTYGNFFIEYREGKLSNLLDVDIIDNLKNIKKDLTLMGYSLYLTDLVVQVVKNDNDKQIYDDYISSLVKINDGYDPMVISNILELKMLNYLGIKPVLDKCSKCGSNLDIITVSSYAGGYICKNCYNNERIVDIKVIKLLRMFYYIDISKISKIEISDDIKKEINNFIDDYYDRYAGLYLKSKDFLKKVIK